MDIDDFNLGGSDDDDDEEGSSGGLGGSSGGLGSFSSSSAGGGRSGGGGGGAGWNTKIDFSGPYVVVAVDRQGEIYKSKESSRVIDEADHPARLEENPHTEYKVLAKWQTYEGWLRFVNLCQEQLDEDPEEVFEEDPEHLEYLKRRVKKPPGRKPDRTRTCQACGASSEESEVMMLELDLIKNRKTPVCASHSVEELAEAGLLQ